MTDWREAQRAERARLVAAARAAREAAALPDPPKWEHDCPPHCHRCPDMKGEVLPFCTAVAMAMDWEDMSICTCHAGRCTCGLPNHESICECAHIPLLIRQIGLVAYADREHERARVAVTESKRRQNVIRNSRRVAESLVPLTRSLPPSVRGRVDELVRLLRQTHDDVLDDGPPQPPFGYRGNVVRGSFK